MPRAISKCEAVLKRDTLVKMGKYANLKRQEKIRNNVFEKKKKARIDLT